MRLRTRGSKSGATVRIPPFPPSGAAHTGTWFMTPLWLRTELHSWRADLSLSSAPLQIRKCCETDHASNLQAPAPQRELSPPPDAPPAFAAPQADPPAGTSAASREPEHSPPPAPPPPSHQRGASGGGGSGSGSLDVAAPEFRPGASGGAEAPPLGASAVVTEITPADPEQKQDED